MPKHNAGEPHCVDCERFTAGCETRKLIELSDMYTAIDEALKNVTGRTINYHLYSFVCSCDLLERKSTVTASSILDKIILGEELTEAEQEIADRLLK